MDAEVCALSASPQRCWWRFNGWCPAPKILNQSIKALQSPGPELGVSRVHNALPNQDLLQRDNFKQLVRLFLTSSPSVRVIKGYLCCGTEATPCRQELLVVGKELVLRLIEERLRDQGGHI